MSNEVELDIAAAIESLSKKLDELLEIERKRVQRERSELLARAYLP